MTGNSATLVPFIQLLTLQNIKVVFHIIAQAGSSCWVLDVRSLWNAAAGRSRSSCGRRLPATGKKAERDAPCCQLEERSVAGGDLRLVLAHCLQSKTKRKNGKGSQWRKAPVGLLAEVFPNGFFFFICTTNERGTSRETRCVLYHVHACGYVE